MTHDITVHEYFTKHAPQISGLTVRTTNALMRGKIETMNALCERDEESLKQVRNMGEKCISYALAMRDKYSKEKQKHKT